MHKLLPKKTASVTVLMVGRNMLKSTMGGSEERSKDRDIKPIKAHCREIVTK